jgi:TPR repeat protein
MRILTIILILCVGLNAFEKGSFLSKAKLSQEDIKVLTELSTSNTEAAELLGDFYRKGWKVKKDHQKAIELYKRANNSYKAVIGMALIYHRAGDNVLAKLDKAESLYRLAALKSDEGKFLYGLALETNLKGKPDFKEALNVYKLGANASGNCAFKVAMAYQLGRGVKQDFVAAYSLHESAIRLAQYPQSFYEISFMKRHGLGGIKRDLKGALGFCSQAALRGVQRAEIEMVSLSIHNGDLQNGYFWYLVCFKTHHVKPPEISPYKGMLENSLTSQQKKLIEREVKKIIAKRKFAR